MTALQTERKAVVVRPACDPCVKRLGLAVLWGATSCRTGSSTHSLGRSNGGGGWQATGSQEEKMAFNVEFSDRMKGFRDDKMKLMKELLRME